MARTLPRLWQPAADAGTPARPLDLRKKISDHVAYALLVYTGLQIFGTMTSLHGRAGSMLPYFALIVLVAAIIPACRRFERRWARLSDEQAADPAFVTYYRRDRMWLWILALGLPFVVIATFRVLAIVFG